MNVTGGNQKIQGVIQGLVDSTSTVYRQNVAEDQRKIADVSVSC